MFTFQKKSNITEITIQNAQKINLHFLEEHKPFRKSFYSNFNNKNFKYSTQGTRLIIDLAYNDKITDLYLHFNNLKEMLLFRSFVNIDILTMQKPIEKIIVEQSDLNINFLLKKKLDVNVIDKSSFYSYIIAVKNLELHKSSDSDIKFEKGFIYNANIKDDSDEFKYDCLFYKGAIENRHNKNIFKLQNPNYELLDSNLNFFEKTKIEFYSSLKEGFFVDYIALILLQNQYFEPTGSDIVKESCILYIKSKIETMFSTFNKKVFNIKERFLILEKQDLLNNDLEELNKIKYEMINLLMKYFYYQELRGDFENTYNRKIDCLLINIDDFHDKRLAISTAIDKITENNELEKNNIEKEHSLNSKFQELMTHDFPTSLITKDNQVDYRNAILKHIKKIKTMNSEEFENFDKLCYILDIDYKSDKVCKF